MIGRQIVFAVCMLPGLVGALAWAQTPGAGDASPIVAKLQTRLKKLEQENAGLRRDYELILTTCQGQSATASASASPASVEDDPPQVIPVDYSIIESNRIFTSYAWTVTISNSLDRAQAFDVSLHFLDRNGSLIETDRDDNEVLDAHEQRTLTGSYVIPMPGALNVASMRAVAKRTR